MRIVDRVAYINHDIDDAIRYGILEEGDLPRDEIDVLGPTGAKRIDRLVHDLVESSDAAGDIVQGDEVGAAMLSLRGFMFEHVYLGPEAKVEHERADETIARIYRHLTGLGQASDDVVEFIAGMTDRFALSYAERLSPDGTDQGHLGRGGEGGGGFRRRRLGPDAAPEGGRRALHGPLPVPRGAHPVLLGQRRRQALLLLRLRREGRPDHVRARDGRSRLRRRDRVARRALPRATRVRGELACAGRRAQATRAALRAARPGGDVLRAHALGLRGRRDGARLPQGPRPERGRVSRVPPRARARRRHARAEGAREGLYTRRAPCRRADAAARRRLLLAPAPLPARRRARPRARLPGSPAATTTIR